MAFKAKNSYAKRIFTEQLYIKHLLHQRIIYIKTAFLHLFTLNSFLHRHLIHRKLRLCQLRNKISTEDCFTRFFYRAFLKDMLTTEFLGKESLMTDQVEQLLMTAPKSVKYGLNQTPFASNTFYTSKLVHQETKKGSPIPRGALAAAQQKRKNLEDLLEELLDCLRRLLCKTSFRRLL